MCYLVSWSEVFLAILLLLMSDFVTLRSENTVVYYLLGIY